MTMRPGRRMPLRTWLLGLVAMHALVLSAFAAISFSHIRENRRSDLAAQLEAQTGALSTRLRYALRSAADAAAMIGALDLGDGRCGDVLGRIHAKLENYAVLGVTASDGRVLCASPARSVGVDVSDRPWFRRALATGEPAVGGYQRSRITGKPDLIVAVPVENGLAALVGVGLDLSWLSAFLGETGRPEDGVLGVLDSELRPIARHPQSDSPTGEPISRSGLSRAIAAYPALSGVGEGDDGVERLYDGQWIEIGGTRFFVYSGQALTPSLSLAREVWVRQLAAVGLAALLLGLGGYLFMRRDVAKPLAAVSRYAEAVAAGQRPDGPGASSRADEVARLGEAISRMAEALRRQERDMARACQLARLSWWRARPEADEVECSGEMLEILGLGALEGPLSLTEVRRAVHPEDAAAFEDLLARPGRTQSRRVEFRVLRPDGQARHILAEVAGAAPGAGEAAPLEGICQDVTERRELEARYRLSQRLDSLGKLTGGIAHDFNNVLTVVLGNAETLEAELPPDGPLHRAAALTRRAAERGMDATRRLLAFARRRPLEPSLCDADAAVRDIAALLTAALGDRARLRLDPGAAGRRVRVDEGELENALVNLAINARDAMAGGGEVRLVTRPRRVASGEPDAAGAEMKPGDYVAISVVDQGEGMSEAVQAQALEPFFTTKADRPGRDGSGLGLSIVYGFARASEGHLKIDSRPGEGTSVTLLLPWEAVPPRPEDAVLVLAPEAEAREALADALREIGREAALAADTETALAALETLPAPALLVLGLSPQAAEAAAARARALIPGLPVLPLDVETTPGRPRNPSALTAALRGALASV